jgi:hypothetical protein
LTTTHLDEQALSGFLADAPVRVYEVVQGQVISEKEIGSETSPSELSDSQLSSVSG